MDGDSKNAAKARDAEGVIDLDRLRYMIDFGAYAVLQTDTQEWSGHSGRSLSTLPAGDPTEPAPFWLLELLAVLRTATEADHQEVRGVECQHYHATVEAGHAWTVLDTDPLARGPRGSCRSILDWTRKATSVESRLGLSNARRRSNCGTSG